MFGELRHDVMLFGQLFEAGEQHFALDLVADLLLKAAFDQLARRLPGRKPATLASTTSSLELLTHAPVDGVAVDGDLDVLFQHNILDDNILDELFRFFFTVLDLGRRRGRVGLAFPGWPPCLPVWFRQSWYPTFGVRSIARSCVVF